MNVTLIDRRSIRGVVVHADKAPFSAVTRCAIVVERGGVRHQVDVPLGQLPPPSLEALATELGRRVE